MSLQRALSPAETYEHYLGRNIADPWTRVLLAHASPQSGERVLDLACGTGSVARQVAPLVGESGHVVALDVNAEMLAVGMAQPAPQGGTIDWREGDATSLELPEREFDLVLCQQGLQFFSDQVGALHGMCRVLRHSGRVGISVWQSLHRHPLYEALFMATARHLDIAVADVDIAFSLSDSDELYRLLEFVGFQDVEVRTSALEIRLPDAKRFVDMSIVGAATSVPAFTRMAPVERAVLMDAIRDETQGVVQRFQDGDSLAFPMETNIATAKR
ncbi:class I SAM-dependent methyltransferase [Orrella marina]|uniref:SAM-dependent methyltransferase n=1 Tax=Orrella marina TaxID=2163011 RepID=A0A2R4XJI5_9BURK|nr:methyltransferase domain-containing protein [Orrella marina]AWB34002.1 SAM-dependent methyltransferase [Orrella marina]